MMINLTFAEQDALGFPEWSGTAEELSETAYNCWIVWDDAPMPYWQRAKPMKALENLAKRIGHPFEVEA
jgi:hypothetical protein